MCVLSNCCASCRCSELSAADALSVFDKVSSATSASPGKAQSYQHRPPAPAGIAAGTHPAGCTADGGCTRPAGLVSEQRQSTFMRCVTQQLLQQLEADTGSDAVLTAGTQPADSADTGAACGDAGGTCSSACSSALEGTHSPMGCSGRASRSGQCSSGRFDARRPTSQGSMSGGTSGPSSDMDSSSEAAVDQSVEQGTAAGELAGAITAPALVCVAGGCGGARRAVLTAAQFLQAMVLLSRRCFPRIANASRAWQLLLERHVQPLADRKRSR